MKLEATRGAGAEREMTIRLKVSLERLCRFLVDAKFATFAGNGPRVKSGYIRIYRYSEDDWDYEDRYTGNLLDTGMEIVRLRSYPIWTMCYRGGMLIGARHLSRQTFDFLKEALRRPPLETPIRGPPRYSRNKWVYENSIDGGLTEFTGFERILLGSEAVYQRRYLGGLVHDRGYNIALTNAPQDKGPSK